MGKVGESRTVGGRVADSSGWIHSISRAPLRQFCARSLVMERVWFRAVSYPVKDRSIVRSHRARESPHGPIRSPANLTGARPMAMATWVREWPATT